LFLDIGGENTKPATMQGPGQALPYGSKNLEQLTDPLAMSDQVNACLRSLPNGGLQKANIAFWGGGAYRTILMLRQLMPEKYTVELAGDFEGRAYNKVSMEDLDALENYILKDWKQAREIYRKKNGELKVKLSREQHRGLVQMMRQFSSSTGIRNVILVDKYTTWAFGYGAWEVSLRTGTWTGPERASIERHAGTNGATVYYNTPTVTASARR